MKFSDFAFTILTVLIISFIVYKLLYDNGSLTETYIEDKNPYLEQIINDLSIIIPEIKSIEIYGSNKSYTLNKEKIFICHKDKYGNYYDYNSLIYVILHELSHYYNKKEGHGEEFKIIFSNLLDKAEEHNLWNRNIPMVENYCN